MQFTITPYESSRFQGYLIEFQTAAPFDDVELKLNAGIPGTSNSLMAFCVYLSVEPMPIRLLTFNAMANENVVDIKWTTASEINDYFTIERSTDAKKFVPIAKIKGQKNSTLKRNYQYTD